MISGTGASGLEPGKRHEDRDLTTKEAIECFSQAKTYCPDSSNTSNGPPASASRRHGRPRANSWMRSGPPSRGTNSRSAPSWEPTATPRSLRLSSASMSSASSASLRVPRSSHPKIYVFEFGSGKPVAWVGSANFTRAGFENRNVETVYETKDVNPSLEWFEQQWGQSKRASQRVIDDYRERRRRNPPSREFQKFVGESESAAPEPLLPPEAQTWDPVLDPEEIRAAFDRMRATLIDDADELDRRVGYLSTVYWRDDPGYWCAFGRRRHGHWIPFGPENPEKSTQLGSGCLQINPPFDGNSEYAGIYAGLFVRNDSGDIFLARNLNKIPGVNKEDLERRLNESLPGRIFNFPWRRRTRRMVVLGEVGSGELRKTVAELVRLVAELKGAGTGAGETP